MQQSSVLGLFGPANQVLQKRTLLRHATIEPQANDTVRSAGNWFIAQIIARPYIREGGWGSGACGALFYMITHLSHFHKNFKNRITQSIYMYMVKYVI